MTLIHNLGYMAYPNPSIINDFFEGQQWLQNGICATVEPVKHGEPYYVTYLLSNQTEFLHTNTSTIEGLQS